MRTFCSDATEQKIHSKESLEWYILQLRAQWAGAKMNENIYLTELLLLLKMTMLRIFNREPFGLLFMTL